MNDTLHWFKSSYSDGGGGDCVEAAFPWHKSSHSDGGGGNCVEVSPCTCPAPATVHVRDSKNPTGPTLTLSSTAWAAFLASA
ncbi:DUF397 domain-containing protein [Streptomyces albidoflavus]|uniref:DUF397 domain-containing protein n=1 Tax=Streptomyces albidoflavus TaxID=1886 RepID=UPI00101E60AA|nr:DUF397 domain-containing protein [Streptomyces albidoflavus]RZE92638.1 DUF397 domain-containing protein [Streptomyces albidoflavus]RZE93837.1 DUF397 domain-containing protein [Streptomyces albidoflavus]